MSKFEPAFEFILPNEGGFVDNKNDSGGATNFGISIRFLREVSLKRLKRYGIFGEINVDLIKHLTLDQAKLIYEGEFWEKASFNAIMEQAIANYIFDMAVNFGISRAIKITQRALWSMFAMTKRFVDLKDDGILGQQTLAAINAAGSMLAMALPAERAGFYRLLAATIPKNREFLNGWLKRSYII